MSSPTLGVLPMSEAAFRTRVGALADELLDWPSDELATRAVIEHLAKAGVLQARWARRDHVLAVALIDELSRRGLSSTAVAVSLHTESALGMLRQFARPALAGLVTGALDGSIVGCVAASEPAGGSDLSAVTTTASPVEGGWHIVGDKKFVTLATQADVAVVLARMGSGPHRGRTGAFVVPREGFTVVRTHRLVAGSKLDTSWIRVDGTVGADHLLGRPGLGIAVFNWGLTNERLAIAALVVGTCRLALTLAVTHATRRRQFGVRLLDHQAIRLRLAQLDAELHTLASDLDRLARQPAASRRIAGLKVTAARFGERCLSECMHIFGGDGYLEDATPLGRLWRDLRLARIGGGTDEMMWEIVASGLEADPATYHRHIPADPPDPGGDHHEVI